MQVKPGFRDSFVRSGKKKLKIKNENKMKQSSGGVLLKRRS